LGDGKRAKIAVITGAAQRIGRRTAEVFAERGYGLVLAHSQERLRYLRWQKRRAAGTMKMPRLTSSNAPTPG